MGSGVNAISWQVVSGLDHPGHVSGLCNTILCNPVAWPPSWLSSVCGVNMSERLKEYEYVCKKMGLWAVPLQEFLVVKSYTCGCSGYRWWHCLLYISCYLVQYNVPRTSSAVCTRGCYFYFFFLDGCFNLRFGYYFCKSALMIGNPQGSQTTSFTTFSSMLSSSFCSLFVSFQRQHITWRRTFIFKL
jgi:hypothetical protein